MVALALFFATPSFSQVYNGPDSLQLSQINWKSKSDLLKTIDDELTQVNSYLATPGLQEVDLAVFSAEKKLLLYMQPDIENGKQVHETIMTSYKKVLADAKIYPQMAKLPYGMLGTYLPGLIESLTAVTKPSAH